MTSRRPRRIASDEAHAWARNLRLGNPHAKLVLCMLAGYVNGEGACFVSISLLAEDCELVENTVRRRLGLLESIGAIAKTPQWIDESGRRNGEGRGRRTTDEIRLLLDADPEEIEARAQGGDDGPNDQEADASSPAPGEGSDSADPALGVHLPCTSMQGLTSEPEPESPTPTPPKGGAMEDKISPDARERWQRFKIGYPDGMTDPITAEAEFHKLTDPEQEQAIAAEPIFGDRCRRRREKPMKAHLFLRKRAFEGLLAAPPESGSMGGCYDPASEAGKALIVLARIAKASLPRTGDGRIIYTKPITPQLLALANAPHERIRYEIGSNSFGAWRELIRAHLSNPPNLTEIDAPWPYPPSKDGKVYAATGPPRIPGTLMTEDDERVMAKL